VGQALGLRRPLGPLGKAGREPAAGVPSMG